MLELRKDIFADERDDNLKEIGKGTQRQDMLGHVTGTSTYFDDHKLQGMLHLEGGAQPACARAPAPHRHDGGRTRAGRAARHPRRRRAASI